MSKSPVNPADQAGTTGLARWAFGVVLTLWLATATVLLFIHRCEWVNAGQFGDTFGAINALFSGLAFAGVIWAIRLQQHEIKQNLDEQRYQAHIFSEQVQVMRQSARLTALPVMIEHARLRTVKQIAAVDPNSAHLDRAKDDVYSLLALRDRLLKEYKEYDAALSSFRSSGQKGAFRCNNTAWSDPRDAEAHRDRLGHAVDCLDELENYLRAFKALAAAVASAKVSSEH